MSDQLAVKDREESPVRLALLSFHSSPAGRLGSKDTGGMSVYIRQLAEELGKRHYSLDVFTRRSYPDQASMVPLSPGVRLISLPAGPAAVLDKGRLHPHLPQFVQGIDEFRRQQGLRYDVLYSHYWLSGWAGHLLQPAWDVPHVTMFHTVGAMKQAAGVGDAEPMLRLEKERELAHSCHRLIVATGAEKRQLIEHYSAPSASIRIVPLGVDLRRFQPQDHSASRRQLGLSESDRIILYVGRLDAIKGIERLIRAVLQLPRRQGVKLVVVGGGEESQRQVERLHDMARAENALDMLDFRGLVEQEELPLYYSATNVCAVVSYYESFGLVALEAMACGTPVIASDVGIVRQIIQEPVSGAVLKADHSPEVLAQQLARQLAQPQPDPWTVRQGVRQYGWCSTARKFQEVLAEFRL